MPGRYFVKIGEIMAPQLSMMMHHLNHNNLMMIVHVQRDSVRRANLPEGTEYEHQYKCKHQICSNLGSCNILFAEVQRGEGGKEKSEL